MDVARERRSPTINFSFRAVAVGVVVGSILCFSNVYFGLQTGWRDWACSTCTNVLPRWVTMGSVPSSIIGFMCFQLLSRRFQCKNSGRQYFLYWWVRFSRFYSWRKRCSPIHCRRDCHHAPDSRLSLLPICYCYCSSSISQRLCWNHSCNFTVQARRLSVVGTGVVDSISGLLWCFLCSSSSEASGLLQAQSRCAEQFLQIIKEKLPFPSGTATAHVFSLVPHRLIQML